METKIIFKDGTELTVEKNGDCLILTQKPSFPEDLSTVTVQAEDGTREYHNAQVLECASVDGRFWFAFTEESEADRTIRELKEQNDMLTECVLEMSEIVYGGDL